MSFLEDPGPEIRVLDEDFASVGCELPCSTCDPETGMLFVKHYGNQDMKPGEQYAGRIVCRGLRQPTPEEVLQLESLDRPVKTICDLEIHYIRE